MRPRQITDEQIIEVARRMFFEHGPGVSTNAIARELDISQAALFKRFGTKAGLIRRAMKLPSTPPWVEMLEHGPDPERPIQAQLEAIGLAINDFFEELAPAAAVMKLSGCAPEDLFEEGEVPTPVIGLRALAEWLEAAKQQGRARFDNAQITAMSMLGALHIRPFFEHMFQMRPCEAEQYVREVVATHWKAMAPE